ncbi:class I SAM-dependent methyltransferase [Noviherbaspirillum sp. CPCC 100848]|uniref:Class I SAM-dependent methyltransferase n=1 Tax=Noviherbaspirillum album TaxID=3080276 RepID=A0ABU6JII8_9BURK|nr:class I SAM-dependent methyltransferase [Noviherbaspirillum sp. CPCC 100848]MEC4723228.1 class I SAM-dependent methyltransferase [Noviherbaspirillum sp. CPCC 100848]
MKQAINAQYHPTPGGAFVDKILASQRRKLFDAFLHFKQGNASDTTLNVGMMPGPVFEKPDLLDAWCDQKERSRILSYQIEPPSGGTPAELQLPFSDGAFDWVFCNEVIEHVGGSERQFALVKELFRIARKGVFVSTSNRKHPIEFNTGLPLLHLLPQGVWQRLLRMGGKRHWTSPGVLNLIDAPALYRFAEKLPGSPQHDVGHKRVFGAKAHFFLMVNKAARSA